MRSRDDRQKARQETLRRKAIRREKYAVAELVGA